MKTISFQRRNALFSTAGFSAGVFALVFVVVLATFRLFFPGVFIELTTPLFAVGSSLTSVARDLRATYEGVRHMAHERDQLRLEKSALENERVTLLAKIEDLTALLGVAPDRVSGIVAAVLARPPQSPYDTLLVGAGATSGVSLGMRVRGAGGVPMGEVESVTATKARVVLYSSPGKSLGAVVGARRVPITLTGMGAGTFLATVPKGAEVGEGDIVYLSSTEANAIALVRKVETDLASPSATLLIASIANPFSTVWVILAP